MFTTLQEEYCMNVASYKRICAEFGIDPSTDFRFTYWKNHGLGYVNIMYSDGPFAHKKWKYPPADLSNPSSQRLKGDSGTTDNNTIASIRNDQGADKQFEYFCPTTRQASRQQRARSFERGNRDLLLLHPRCTGRHRNQYCRSHRPRQECAESFPPTCGRRNRKKGSGYCRRAWL